MKVKSNFILLLLIVAAFFCGLAWNSKAACPTGDCPGMLCDGNVIATSKPLIADAGLMSTKTSQFTGSFYASKGGNSVNVDEHAANMIGASGQSAISLDFGGPGVTAIGSTFENGHNTYLTVDDVNQVVTISNVPTADPHIPGALYSVGGVLHVSGG